VRHKLLEDGFRVLHDIERNIRFLAAARALAVAPFGFKLLNVRAVAQHDVAEVVGGSCGVHRTLESVFIQQRQETGVIHMRVGEQYRIDFSGDGGQAYILVEILALLHAVVHKDVLAAEFEVCTAACNLVIRADKGDFHVCWPFRARFDPNKYTTAIRALPPF